MRYDLLGRPRYTKKTIWENEVQRNGAFYDRIHSDGLEDANYNPEHTLNAYYNGKAGEWGIDFNADYYRMKQDILTSTTEESQEEENRLVQATNPVENQLAAAKLVFSHPLWGGEVSFGSEYTYTARTDDYLSQSTEYVPTVYSKIREHNVAAFVEYAHSFPFGDIAVGARYEHDAFDYYENHQHLDAAQQRELLQPFHAPDGRPIVAAFVEARRDAFRNVEIPASLRQFPTDERCANSLGQTEGGRAGNLRASAH